MALERPVESLSDDELLGNLDDLLRQSRRVEAPLVAHIGEVHARHLYARYAASSMFSYCTTILHLSEGEAQLRINVAKAARQHPILLDMLADGRLHLSGIGKLAPVLTLENRDALLARAVYKSKRQIEEMVAELAPRPDAPTVMRKLPDRPMPSPVPARVELSASGGGPAGVEAAFELPRSMPAPRPIFEPLSPARYKVQFTAGPELRDDLERLRELLRTEVPDGDLGAIIGKAVRILRQRLEGRRFAQTQSPRKPTVTVDGSSRYIPAAVRRFVYRRDRSRCCFADAKARRCPERHRLEYHHRHPFALGGEPRVDNIFLMCKVHNRHHAELDYGRKKMSRYRRSAREPGREETDGMSRARSE
jgi:hypothetical protein